MKKYNFGFSNIIFLISVMILVPVLFLAPGLLYTITQPNNTIPQLNMVQKINLPDAYVYKILVPEFTKDDIKFELIDDTLYIKYNLDKVKSSGFIVNKHRLLISSRLDNSLDKNNIDIKMDNGIVIITIPKKPIVTLPIKIQ
jgi:HSP20 family molecular chaperone IbpA